MIRSWTGVFKCAALLAVAFFGAAGGAEAAWVNSDIADFPAGAKAPAYHDDFHRAVNHDWLSKAKIRKGEVRIDSFSERSDEVEAQIKKLFKDRSLNSHEAALVQKFHGMLRDWKSRDRLGMEPVIPYVKRIEAIKDMEGLTAYLTDSRDPHLGSQLFDIGVMADRRD